MRIAYVLGDSGIPVFGTKGASIHVREIVKALVKLGHQVTLFVLQKGQQDSFLDADINVISTTTKTVLTVSHDTINKTKENELQLIHMNELLYQKLVDAHQSSPFDLIYERYSLFGNAGVKSSAYLNIPLVLEVNSPLIEEQLNYRELYHQEEARKIEQDVFNNAAVISAVSDEIKQYISSKQRQIKNTHVIPNAVDTDFFHPTVIPSFIPPRQGSKVIGFVGSLKPWHGLEILLNGFRTLITQQLNYHLLIVGDGPLRDWIEGYACGAKIEDEVTITGWIAHQELPGLIKSMDIAVAPYPKLDHFYFSPLKLYEYMATGTPVIASRIGQIQKFIDHNNNGLLIEPGRTEELCISLQSILDKPEHLLRLAQAARQSTENLTWVNNAKKIVELVQQKIQLENN